MRDRPGYDALVAARTGLLHEQRAHLGGAMVHMNGEEPYLPDLEIPDGMDDEHAAEDRERLRGNALATDVMVSNLSSLSGTPVERYVTVLQQGLFAAAYLQIGLGRTPR